MWTLMSTRVLRGDPFVLAGAGRELSRIYETQNHYPRRLDARLAAGRRRLARAVRGSDHDRDCRRAGDRRPGHTGGDPAAQAAGEGRDD